LLEGLQQLIDLQVLDAELVSARAEQGEIPALREHRAEEGSIAQQKIETSTELTRSAEAEQRQVETTLQDQEALVLKLEGQTSQVKTNEAYTALLSEIEQAKEAISEAETQILEGMERIEEAGVAQRGAENGAAEVYKRIEVEEKACDERERALAARIAELDGARSETTARVPAELLEQYDKIATRRRPAVVTVSAEICLGCRVDIPPQLFVELIRGKTLIQCGNCHRILIHERNLQ
jgi:hypothetical protein